MSENRLSLREFLNLCVNFESDPSEENDKKIQDFLGQLQIKEYLSLKEKAIIAMSILSDIGKDFDAIGTSSMLEMGKIFHGLCSYVVNLDMDIDFLSKTYAAYDVVMRYGFYDKVSAYCEKDYMRLCNYIDNSINASNIYYLIQTAALLDNERLEEWTKVMDEVKETLTPEVMKSLETVNLANKDVTKELFSAIAENSLAKAQKILADEKIKYEAIGKSLKSEMNNSIEDNGDNDKNKV